MLKEPILSWPTKSKGYSSRVLFAPLNMFLLRKLYNLPPFTFQKFNNKNIVQAFTAKSNYTGTYNRSIQIANNSATPVKATF
ncbi:hypothetical protein Zm00014a_026414 [Zea mays]|uniref:Uncharacterized protein n=1 Tax=Zea mays TaxID=4577 RepID=A0A3L6FE36_MAIZE|nr:hypothetical protein Zm00014a_026414 [Zea mays]